jgi:hypothetical protein
VPVNTTAPPITPSTSGKSLVSSLSKRWFSTSATLRTAAWTWSALTISSALASRARARV